MAHSNSEQANECKQVYYLQQISSSLQDNLFKTPWASVVVKNCDDEGKLLEFKSKTEYSSCGKELWLNLELKIFRENGDLYPVFCCPECPSMRNVKSINIDCERQQFLPLLCFHSKAVSFLVNDWDLIWDIVVVDDDETYEVLCNQDILALTLHKKEHKNEGFFLAATLVSNKVYVLYTATKRQNVPTCSGHSCHLSNCAHMRKFKDTVQSEDYDSVFDPLFQNNQDQARENVEPVEDEGLIDHNESVDDSESNSNQHPDNVGEGEQRNGRNIDDSFAASNMHYLNELTEQEYTKMCGYNFTPITYPFKNCRRQQELWKKHLRQEYDFPERFVPPYSRTKRCKLHGNLYDEDDRNLVREAQNVLIFNEIGEDVLEIEVMCRKTIGACKCMQHVDGHDFCLWHLGRGKFVNYCVLITYLHLWVNHGTPKHSLFKTIKDNSKTNGMTSTISYLDLHRAIVGFFRQLTYDEKKAFACPTHGSTPKWMNTDGKYLGPTKKKCTHLKELDRALDDEEVLAQSTYFKDRVYLPKPKERKEIVKLLSGKHSSEKALEFIENDVIRSSNGQLIKDLVDYIEQKHPGELPSKYRRFIQNICKPTSVRGLMQVTNFIPLDILRSFCNEELSVKNIENIEELRTLHEELPVLWPMLNDICTLDRSPFLPHEVALIVIKLLDIRQNTFINAKKRDDAQYIPYVGREHPTMYYPNNKLKEYPKKYEVNHRIDKDLCEKAFNTHKDFTAGIFSLGCACPYNVTIGFELMLNNESPKNLFRLLKCRDFDLDQVEGILMDHACIMDTYIMNREAPILEWKRLLVDGSHWSAMKKFKAQDGKGKGGHIGCSEGFNWNIYRPTVQEKVNSQGREQLHSLVSNCSESLRLMSYSNFMIFMKIFFAVTNLRNIDEKEKS